MNTLRRMYWLSVAWVLGAVLLNILGFVWAIRHVAQNRCPNNCLEAMVVYIAGACLAWVVILKSDEHYYPTVHGRAN